MSSFVPGHFGEYPLPLGEGPSHSEQTQDPGETHITEVQKVVITACIDDFQAIRTTNLALGLQWIPAGFYVVVKTDSAECQTSNKPVHVDQTVMSAYFCIEKDTRPSIIFQPEQGEVVSSCTLLFITVELRSDENDAAVLCPLTTPMSDDMHALLLRTDARHDLLAHYCRMQHRWDLDQSINHFEHTLDICPMDHPCRPAALFNLATAKFVSCQANETYPDFDISISIFQDALELRHTGHPDRPATQLHLAITLLSHFMKRGFPTDADAAEELLSKVLDVYHANSCIHRAALLAIEILAGSTTGNDLGQERPTASIHPLPLNQLADMAVQCNDEDSDEAITLHGEALAMHPVGHTDRYWLLNNLAGRLSTRFDHRSNDEDLDEAIALHREALALCPIGHTDRSRLSNNLAKQLSTRFKHQDNAEDLDEAIVLQSEALALRLVGHPDRSESLNDPANSLHTCFKCQGNDGDLDEAIALHREALALHPVGDTDQSLSLDNLAVQLSTHFEHRSNGEDLDEGIAHHMEALALCPVGRLSTRFEYRGKDEDLDEAIALLREVLALCPIDHTDRYGHLNNFAISLSTRFKHRGNDEDLDEAIALYREALALQPVGHIDRYLPSNNFAIQLSIHFEHQGNDEDLDEAIALHREVLALLPVGHTRWCSSLDNLTSGLSTHFEHRGNAEDLDEAIALCRKVLALHPAGHIDHSKLLHNLAQGLSSSFQHRHSNNEDLEEAIALQREALALCPLGHTNRSLSLNRLAVQLNVRFDLRGNDEDLDEAIVLHREVLALCPVGHADRPESLNGLADRLSTCFDHRGRVEDLNESRDVLHCLLTLLTQHDPRQLQVHQSLAEVYMLFHQSGLDSNGPDEDIDSLNAAMDHFQAAANIVSGRLLPRLRATLRWVHHASQHSHGTELEAYTSSMRLLDTYMSATASVSSRHNAIKHFPRKLAVDAASCALRSGDVHRAVELLEQGRTVIWTQMTRLCTPLDDLQTRGDHAVTLMKRFKDLSSLLDKPPASHPEGTTRVDIEAEETRYRRLVEDWNGAVEEIQKIEGFSHFLLPPFFSDLQDAAHDGPIIMLIASESSCNAIIIPHKQPPTSIQLPTNFEKLERLMLALREAVEKDASPKGSQPALIKTLRELWNNVVHPANGESLSQQYTSSYTPLLTVLMRVRKSHDSSLSVFFTPIGKNCPAGALSTLDSVEPELELVQSLLPHPPTVSFTKITGVDATEIESTHTGAPGTPDEVIHLAAGLQFAGVKSIVGTLWKVNDNTVQCLVKEFYTNLCGDGKMNSK
ncbi:hypothetical protein F4604DRAFT_1687751 [Suillus subluteus]|nr:hypothetical protein F4604DRAFT_1687751 [Suillus subluteus]